jgi:transposase-like protein
MVKISKRTLVVSNQAAEALPKMHKRNYLRFSLSLRDVEELMAERGLAVDHTAIWR